MLGIPLLEKFLGFVVFGFLVSKILGFLVSKFLGFKMSKFQRFKDTIFVFFKIGWGDGNQGYHIRWSGGGGGNQNVEGDLLTFGY